MSDEVEMTPITPEEGGAEPPKVTPSAAAVRLPRRAAMRIMRFIGCGIKSSGLLHNLHRF